MGALVGNVCYETAALAVDAYYADQGVFQTAGTTTYRGWYQKTGATWNLHRQSIASNGAITNLTTTVAPTPTFPDCDPSERFMDGMELGWGIAAAVVATYAIKFLWNSR